MEVEVPQVGNWIVGQRDGKPFYFNVITGESTREPPLGQVLPNVGAGPSGAQQQADRFGRHRKRPRPSSPSSFRSMMSDLKGTLNVERDATNWVVGSSRGRQVFFNTKTKEATDTPPRVLRVGSAEDSGVVPTASFAEPVASPALIVDGSKAKADGHDGGDGHGGGDGGMECLLDGMLDDMDALELEKLLDFDASDLPPTSPPPSPPPPPQQPQMRPQPFAQPLLLPQPLPAAPAAPAQPAQHAQPQLQAMQQQQRALYLQQQQVLLQQAAAAAAAATAPAAPAPVPAQPVAAAAVSATTTTTTATTPPPKTKKERKAMTKAERLADKKRRNRIAANKSRDKKLAETARLRAEVQRLQSTSQRTLQDLAASRAENRMLREQVEFLQSLIKTALPGAVASGGLAMHMPPQQQRRPGGAGAPSPLS